MSKNFKLVKNLSKNRQFLNFVGQIKNKLIDAIVKHMNETEATHEEKNNNQMDF